MAEFNFATVKNALATDLATIKTTNGFANTIANVYKVPKSTNLLNSSDLPALSLFTTVLASKMFDEFRVSYEPTFSLMIIADINDDITDAGNAEVKIVSIYDDIVTLLNDDTITLYAQDNVESYELADLFIEVEGEKIFGYTSIKIIGG